MTGKEFPSVGSLGKNCQFWNVIFDYPKEERGQQRNGCMYPREEMIGRTSCEGVIDDVCLYLLNGRKPKSLSEEQILKLKLSPPSLTNTFLIPPGDKEA